MYVVLLRLCDFYLLSQSSKNSLRSLEGKGSSDNTSNGQHGRGGSQRGTGALGSIRGGRGLSSGRGGRSRAGKAVNGKSRRVRGGVGVGLERVGTGLDVLRNLQVSADDGASAVDQSEDSLEHDGLGGSIDNVDGGVLASDAQVGAVAGPGDVLGLASSPDGAFGGGAIWFKNKKARVSNLN